MATVKEFVTQAYQPISAHNPTMTLPGNTLQVGIQILNQLLQYYAATGLLLTIAKTVTIPITLGVEEVVCGFPDAIPTPDITLGRLANLESAWLTLTGVTYPLIDKSRDEYLAAWKYDPLKGLPRFIIVFADTDVTRLRLYPAPDQHYEFFLRGKFEMPELQSNDNLDGFPLYFQRFLLLALGKDMAIYTGRAKAWTPLLEAMLREAQDVMESASEVNLSITGDEESLLNGAWRVRAGI